LADAKHGRPAGTQTKEWLVCHLLDCFIDDQSGVTAIEYAAIGTTLSGTFNTIATSL
jgi:hypothetical protein